MNQALKFRDPGFDSLRGLAIFLMIAANAAPFGLAEPHPLWFRAMGSLAAPLFICLAGYFSANPNKPFSYSIKRGGVIIFYAMLMDGVLFRSWPLMGMSVLYLIGCALPFAALCSRMKLWMALIVTLAVFAFGPFLQHAFGYADEAPYHYWSDGFQGIVFQDLIRTVSRSWLFEGWFPLFPWLGFAGLGAILKRLPSSPAFRLIPLALIILGLLGAQYMDFPMLIRQGYSEIFYPPVIPYLLLYAGITIAMIQNVALFRHKVWEPLTEMGKSSLFIYIIHFIVIAYLIYPWSPALGIGGYILLWLGFTGLMVLIAFGINEWKKGRSFSNIFLKVLFSK
jgi:fucose 4-O-acetylase-like acetyltransferase